MTRGSFAQMLALVSVGLSLSAWAMPGGWADQAVTDKQVVAAADAACKSEVQALQKDGKAAKITLSRIVKASSQVVAGTNYRLDLEVKQDGKLRFADIIIWRQLNGQYKLTSWTWKEDAKPTTGRGAGSASCGGPSAR